MGANPNWEVGLGDLALACGYTSGFRVWGLACVCRVSPQSEQRRKP